MGDRQSPKVSKFQSWINSWLPNYTQIHTGKQKDALRFGRMVESSLSSNSNFAKKSKELIDLVYSGKDSHVGIELENFIEKFKIQWIARQRKTEEFQLLKKFLALDYSQTKVTGSTEQDKLIQANNDKARKNRMALSKLLSQNYSSESIKSLGEAKEFLEDRINQIYDFEKKQIKILPRDTNKESPYVQEVKDLNKLFNGFYSQFYLKNVVNANRDISKVFQKDDGLESKVKSGVGKVKSQLKQLNLDAELIHVLTFPYKTADDIKDVITDFSQDETTRKLIDRQIRTEGYSSLDSYLNEIREPMHKKAKNRLGKLGLLAAMVALAYFGPGFIEKKQVEHKLEQVEQKRFEKNETDLILNAQIPIMSYGRELIDIDYKVRNDNLLNNEEIKKLDSTYFKGYENNFRKFIFKFLRSDVKKSLDEKIRENLSATDSKHFTNEEGETSIPIFDRTRKEAEELIYDQLPVQARLNQKKYMGLLNTELWNYLRDHAKKSGKRIDNIMMRELLLNPDYKKSKETHRFYSTLSFVQNTEKPNVDFSDYSNQKFMNLDDAIKAYIKSGETIVNSKHLGDLNYGYDVLILRTPKGTIVRPVLRFDTLLFGNRQNKVELVDEITRFAKSNKPYLEMSRGFDKENANAIINLEETGSEKDLDFLTKYNKIIEYNYGAWLRSQAFMNEPFKSLDLVNDPNAWLNLKALHDEYFMDHDKRIKIWNLDEVLKWSNKSYVENIDPDLWHNNYNEWMKNYISKNNTVNSLTESINWITWSSITNNYQNVLGTHIFLAAPEINEFKLNDFNSIYKVKLNNIKAETVDENYLNKLKRLFPAGYNVLEARKIGTKNLNIQVRKKNLEQEILLLQKYNYKNLKVCLESPSPKLYHYSFHRSYIKKINKSSRSIITNFLCRTPNYTFTTHGFLDNFMRNVELTE